MVIVCVCVCVCVCACVCLCVPPDTDGEKDRAVDQQEDSGVYWRGGANPH